MEKIKLYVLTGFLGSGKTTMLLNLLEHIGREKKIGIIQNEFGKLSIDGDIIRRGDIEMVEIARGSIFCSCLKLNFVQALAEMSRKGLDCLFVESSGLADPSNLQEILDAAAVLCGGEQPYTLAGTICLVDGVDFLTDAQELETVRRQIIHCNIALLNKRDLIDDARAAEVTAEIRRLNDRCLIVETVDGVIEPALLEQDLTDFPWAACEDTTNTADTKPKTFSIEFDGGVEREKLTAFLRAVLGDSYRIKGFCLADGAWQQVDVVGDRIDYKPCGDMGVSRLIFISRVGIRLIREINDAWEQIVGLPVRLKN